MPSLERCHWYANALPMPLQVPGAPVRVEARCTLPLSVGRTVFTGGALGIVAVGTLVAVTVASGFDAVTNSRTLAPTSPTVSS